MVRRTPMPRATVPLPRTTSAPSRPRYTGPDAATRSLVYARDGYRCVVCGTDDDALVLHHRSGRRAGGSSDPTKNSPANLLTACEQCNLDLERPPRRYADGLLVRSWNDPAEVPVQYRGRMVLLSDDGSVRDAA